jgi:hypothetical protein
MALPPLRMELTNFGGPIKFQNFRIFGGEKNEMYHKIEKVDFFTEKFSVELFADFFSVFADFFLSFLHFRPTILWLEKNTDLGPCVRGV